MPTKKKEVTPDPNYFAWVVAYIDSAYLKNVEADLSKYPEYAEVSAFIPTVKILKKTFKKENFFEEVPLLFNYGFFRVPRKYAVFRNWLDNMKKNVSCIYAWVNDPQKVIATKPRLRLDGREIDYSQTGDYLLPVATATSEEISELIKSSVNVGAHSSDDLNLLKVGDTITLRGYPFENLQATLLDIDHKKERVKVKISTGIFEQCKEVSVSFDNVFFTIYHNNKNYFPDVLSENSIDAIVGGNKLGGLFNKAQIKQSNSDNQEYE